MDYLKLYELETEPFRNEPDPRFYFESTTHARTRLRIARAVTQHLGLAVLLGGRGCGKTTLAYGIESGLQGDGSLVRRVSVPRSEGDEGWLLAQIASEFGVPEPSIDPLQALEQLEKRLVQVGEQGRHPVLLLDEAQMLRKRARLEDLRALLNLEHSDGRRVLTVVLFGLPELLETLEQDPSLLQRVEIRQELRPLTLDEATAYVLHRIECAGGPGDLFTPEALDALAQLSEGVPRVLNSLADNTLFEGALVRARPVDASLVAAACEAVGIEIAGDVPIGTAPEAANMELATPTAELPIPRPLLYEDELDAAEPATEIEVSLEESGCPVSEVCEPELEFPDRESPPPERPRRAEIAPEALGETKTLDPDALDQELLEESLLDLDLDPWLGAEEEVRESAGEGSDPVEPSAVSQILGLPALADEVPGTPSESRMGETSQSDSALDFDLELELELDPGGSTPDASDAPPPERAEQEDPIGAFKFEGESAAEPIPPVPARQASNPVAAEAPTADDENDDSLDMLDSLFEGIQI